MLASEESFCHFCYIYISVSEHYNIAYILKFVNNSHQGHPISILIFEKSQLLHCEVTSGGGVFRPHPFLYFSTILVFIVVFLNFGDGWTWFFSLLLAKAIITSNMWHLICLWLKRGMLTAIITKHGFIGTIGPYLMQRKKAPPSGKKRQLINL